MPGTDRYVDAAFRCGLRAHLLLPGEEGASLDQYVRIADDILFNPEGTIERVKQAYEQQL